MLTSIRALDGEPWQSLHGVPRLSFESAPWQSHATTLSRRRARAQAVCSEQYWAPLRSALYELERALRTLCVDLGISASVAGRIKSFDAICRKIQIRRVFYHSIYDLAGIRVIVGSTAECYRLLECVHRRYRQVPGHVRDYVARPKSNGYRSLHTTVLNFENIPVEIQLRTFEMDQQAAHGRAALRSWAEARVEST